MPSALLPSGQAADFSAARESSTPRSAAPEGGSAYDQVSRQEQARLSRRQAEDRRLETDREADRQQSRDAASDAREAKDSRRREASAQSADSGREHVRPDQAGHRPEPAEAGDEAGTTRLETADGRVIQLDSEQLQRMADELSMSLEELQSVLQGEDAPPFLALMMQGPGVQTGQAPGVLMQGPLAQALNALPGTASTVPGVTSGAERDAGGLMERMLGQLAAATAGASDAGSKAGELAPLTANRFQGSLEIAGQQLSQTAPGKGGELASPLRSYATTVDLPVGQAQWGDKVMGKLAWLTSQNMSAAEIHLTPPDLGPMEVRVQVQNEQASVTVHAANPAVRDQLEQHSQRLRDMLSEQGLGLEKFDVSDQAAGDGRDSDDSSTASGRPDGLAQADDADADNVVDAGQLDLSWTGEVDLYA